jgi:methylated-DNA-[protein]-cysteine S-methyltransferase
MTDRCCIDVPTPLGNAAIETTNQGVLSVRFVEKQRIASHPAAESSSAAGFASAAAEELSLYFDKRLEVFTTPVDLSWTTLFLRDILLALTKISFGCTVSYTELAKAALRPRAARAVGGAMARNRALIFVPCHRVIAADGRAGGWSGPPGFKEKLHAIEGISTETGQGARSTTDTN